MTDVLSNIEAAYGDLPADWKLERLKFYADVRNSNVDKTVSEDEEPVRLCNYTDVYYNDRITSDLDFMKGSATDAEIARFQLKQGQVIITKDSESWDDIGVPAYVTEDMPNVLCGYHLSVLDAVQELDGKYLAWLCRSEPLNDQFKLGANGVTRYGLGQYPMKNAIASIPPLETQQRISRFLDEKTARIDGLIKKKRTLLERLTEMRQALITRAVTKGLSPEAPMKPSNIHWLGDIPAHWDVLPLKRLREYITSGSRGWAAYYSDEGDIFLRMTNVTSDGIEIDATDLRRVDIGDAKEGTRTAVELGDILITITAELGAVAVVRAPLVGAYINQHLALMRVDRRKADPDYLANYLTTDVSQTQFVANGYGGTKQGLGFEQIDGLHAVCPPLREQQEISMFCADARRISNDLVRPIEQSLVRLQEYRAGLITSAVTGKIEGLQ